MNAQQLLSTRAGRLFLGLPPRLQHALTWLLAGPALVVDMDRCCSVVAPVIERALGQSRLRSLITAWAATATALRYAVDSARVIYGPPGVVKRLNCQHNHFDGLHHLDQALAQGRGAVLAASFFSSFIYALMCPWPTAHRRLEGLRMHLVIPHRDPLLVALADRVAYYSGRRIDFIEMGQPAAAVLFARALRQGGVVICMVDNIPDGTAVALADFFGQPACHPAGFLLLAARLGVPVLNCGTESRGAGFVTWFDTPLLPAAAPQGAEVGWLLEQLAGQLEARVRAAPGQWNAWLSLSRKWELAASLQADGTSGAPA